jgi:MarR family transcriptional regulator, organic hydroperoxide resistance regulator
MKARIPASKDKYENIGLLHDDKDYNLWWLITRTYRLINKARTKEVFQTYRLTGAESAALFAIKLIGNDATPSRISRFLLRTPHSIGSLLERMAKEGFVKRVKDMKRKNLVRVTLTEKGNQVYEQAANRQSIHKIMSVLTDEERRLLFDCLTKLQKSAQGQI